MFWIGGGFIPITIYGISGVASMEEFAITTETNIDLLTESGDTLQVEH